MTATLTVSQKVLRRKIAVCTHTVHADNVEVPLLKVSVLCNYPPIVCDAHDPRDACKLTAFELRMDTETSAYQKRLHSHKWVASCAIHPSSMLAFEEYHFSACCSRNLLNNDVVEITITPSALFELETSYQLMFCVSHGHCLCTISFSVTNISSSLNVPSATLTKTLLLLRSSTS